MIRGCVLSYGILLKKDPEIVFPQLQILEKVDGVTYTSKAYTNNYCFIKSVRCRAAFLKP
jgi:hypothetical protein